MAPRLVLETRDSCKRACSLRVGGPGNTMFPEWNVQAQHCSRSGFILGCHFHKNRICKHTATWDGQQYSLVAVGTQYLLPILTAVVQYSCASLAFHFGYTLTVKDPAR